MKGRIGCIKGINHGLDPCSRKGVVNISGHIYCKQHALKVLPWIKILLGTRNKEGLKKDLINTIFVK